MNRSFMSGSIAAVAIALATGCGGSDGPSSSGGIVQITAFSSNSTIIGCGVTLTNPPSNIAQPDLAILQVQMVNTTPEDVFVTGAATSGTIVTATDTTDIGKVTTMFSALAFTPNPAVLVARTGDLTIRVSAPMNPVCQSKPVGYVGTQDINISVRMTTSRGQYVTLPAVIRISWS